MGVRNIIKPINDVILKDDLEKLKHSFFSNFFILGSSLNVNRLLEIAETHSLVNKQYAWYAITLDLGILECNKCQDMKIVFIKPFIETSEKDVSTELVTNDNLEEMFYFDLFLQAHTTVRSTFSEIWQDEHFISCDDFDGSNTPKRQVDFFPNLKNNLAVQKNRFGPLVAMENKMILMNFTMQLTMVEIHNGKLTDTDQFGKWYSNVDSTLVIEKNDVLNKFLAVDVFKVVVVEQRPFIFVDETHSSGFNGYCIDMLEKISKILNIKYTIQLATENQFGEIDDSGKWNGLINDLLDGNADIGLGSIPVTSARERVIDFTIPFYEPVGIIILMKLFHTENSLTKFISVMEPEVWFCIILAFFITSSLIWIFDVYSPDSYRNTKNKSETEEHTRIFTFKESLWFCFTSMTPQGSGDIPKNFSGRLVIASWWLFSFMILSSYTANLAAILTVSMLENPVEGIDDLEKQFKLQYAPLNNSVQMNYFLNMARIEDHFYEVWKNLTMNESLTIIERSQFAVWTFPVSEKYTNIWASISLNGMPENLEEAVKRVKASVSPTDGFAFLGDATDCRYLTLKTCDLQLVGTEFSAKPYAIAVPQGNPLKERLDFALTKLLNSYELDQLKTKWWNENPDKVKCEEPEDKYDGIGIRNMGGIFIMILIGIFISFATLVSEYYWYKNRLTSNVISLRTMNGENPLRKHQTDLMKKIHQTKKAL
ncbi:hypothetical protein HHI36_011031 [Cryptolaemus montrouzieri]|uniref:Uncharacterized protein n=1 Tax=Cryptolaemus montrouzieri TaxID=559131 RepID=A0ABD2MKI6_9CUCU